MNGESLLEKLEKDLVLIKPPDSSIMLFEIFVVVVILLFLLFSSHPLFFLFCFSFSSSFFLSAPPPFPHLSLSLILSHLSLNREGRLGTTNDFATSFLHFPHLSTALWDLANSMHVHSLMMSSHLFLFLPCLPPPPHFHCALHDGFGQT